MLKKTILFILLPLLLCSFFNPPVFAGSVAAEYLCDFAMQFYRMGKYEEALFEFKKVLLIEPDNKKAQEYINNIFQRDSQQIETTAKPIILEKTEPTPLKKIATRDETINDTFRSLSKSVLNERVEKSPTKGGYSIAGVKITGESQVSFGVTPDDFIWKRANYDLNEKVKSWRTSSDAVFNKRFNTYDPRIYDSLSVNLDTENKTGLNFHSNVTADPWSFVGKSSKTTVTGSNGDSAEVELLYWSNTGYVVNSTAYTLKGGETFGIPEIKVKNNKTGLTTATGYRNSATTFSIPEMKIYREFQPIRELWLDYTNDQVKFRAFPFGYQDQAYSSDDPLAITNHRIWWQDSPWLRRYIPGNYNSTDSPNPSFTKGYWDDSLSFLTKDSTGAYLTALRGFSFTFQPSEQTLFDTTVATPKHLWQDYAQVDNLITASRIKHYLDENLMIAGTFTSRLGFKVDDKRRLDSQNYVGGIDLGYEVAEGLKAQAEVLTSKSYYDQVNPDYETQSRGNTYYFSFVTRYPRQSIMDLKYLYDEISLDKSESFLVKSKLYAARMDKGFDSSLSSFHNTRQDTFWSRHIHFRRPFEYYYAGMTKPSIKWDELNAIRIGDGIDNGRNVLGFRIEFIAEDQFSNLFDVRNVHNVNGKFIENVVRDEATAKVTDKLTAKALGIYQKLPRTLGGAGGSDPFIYDGNTGEFFNNSSIIDGNDPTLKTGSFGLNYDFFDWLSLNGIYERTNDYYLAYDGFPANTLRNDTTLGGTYYQNNKLYRFRDPFLYSQGGFPQAPYEFYNVFKAGLRMQPISNMDIYLDYTRNIFESAGQNSDGMNHVGFEMAYMPAKKFGMALKYTYSRWQDTDRLVAGNTSPLGHHNFFGEFRYLPSVDDELILQYGEGNTSPVGNITFDPYGGSLLSIDTQHIFRAYYRRKF